MEGKIIRGIGGFYYVHDGHSRLIECRARGSFRRLDLKPLVGDNVTLRLTEEDPGSGYIEDILPRKNQLLRPAVANVDQALILVTAAHPPFHPFQLDRFLLWMSVQNIPARIGIAKLDLADPEKEAAIRRCYEEAGYPLLSFSAKSGQGLEALEQVLEGKTTVLAGASGVGKSTLLNRLIPAAAMETGELSRKLGRGRHTTRHAEIFCIRDGSFLCDTPGFTALDLPEMEEEELAEHFPEFGRAGACAFRDCRHHREKDCAVRAAANDGVIPMSRYESYTKILEEIRQKRRY